VLGRRATYCVEDPDAAVFAAHAWGFLERDPVRNNVLCTLVEAACVDGPDPEHRWVRVLDRRGGRGEELVGVAVQTRAYSPLLSDLPEPGARALADYFARTHADLTSVNGPTAAAATFATRYAAAVGGTAKLVMRQRLLRLDRVRPPQGVPGGPRAATPADRDLAVAWMRRFSAETLPGGGRGTEDDAAVDRRYAQPELMSFWEVDGAPVSFAWRSPLRRPDRCPSTTVVRISAVYTPPERRGHGYASANVAALSQRALADGASACMLYTDAANPTSNKIYEQVGYYPVGAAAAWQLG
jgi:uncharacterized protein